MKNRKELRILMLEDSQDDIELIERVLRKSELSFVARHVDTREEFENSIRSFEPNIVLSDHGLPQFNSLEALKICVKERASMPFIIVTGTMSDEFAISCLHQGADDYILKSNLSRLPQAIHRAVKERELGRLKREARHALRKQNGELLKVNRELDNFVYSVSHNLRGPLASVMGLLTVASMEKDPEGLKTLHKLMGQSIDKLDNTLKEILDYSRNARSEVKFDAVDWVQVFKKTLGQLEHLKGFNYTKISTDFHIETPFCCDSHRLRAILINLLTNSIMYRDVKKDASVEVSIFVTKYDATIKIRDNGIGISVDVLPKIFSMFYRGSEESQGAGLGLYIAKEIIQKLGGDITIYSEEGVETIATVILPNKC